MQKNKKYLLTMLTFAFVIACIFFFQKDVKAAEKTGTVTLFYDWTGVFNRAMSGRYL